MTRITTVVVLAMMAASVTATADQSRFKVIERTYSPSGRYALAWGLRGRSDVDFKRAGNRNDQYSWDTIVDAKHPVENYLVDVRRGRILTVLKNMDWEPLSVWDRLTAIWDPRERYVLAELSGRYGTRSAHLCTLGRGGVSPQKAVNLQLESDLFHFLDGKTGREHLAYRQVKRRLMLSLRDATVFADGTLVLITSLTVPRRFEEWSYRGLSVYSVRPNDLRSPLRLQRTRDYFVHNGSIVTTYRGRSRSRGLLTLRLWQTPLPRNEDGPGDTRWFGSIRHGLQGSETPIATDKGYSENSGWEEEPLKFIEKSSVRTIGEYSGWLDHSGRFVGRWKPAGGSRSESFILTPISMRWLRPTVVSLPPSQGRRRNESARPAPRSEPS